MVDVPRAREIELDPIRELPYRPAACEQPHQRPDTWQHPTTRRSSSQKIFLHRRGRPHMSQIFLATELGLERWTGLSRQRIELLRRTQFACRSQLALADHVHEFDAGEGRRR